MTRDFSGVDMPTVTEPISNVIAMQPGLTRASSGPLIVGCDSMFLFDGECYGKPHSVEVARERLHRMSGATGELWTGHCVIDFASGRGIVYAGRFRRRVHRRHRRRPARHHRYQSAAASPTRRQARRGLDRPVERGPRGIGARRQDRRQRSRAAQGERASARRRLDRLRMRAQALGIERCLRRAARAA